VVVRAAVEEVTGTDHGVILGGPEGVHTVEHLLSAAWALGIDNLDVLLSGAEVPAMDGSALSFVRAFRAAGIRAQAARRSVLRVREPVWAGRDDGWAVALPAAGFAAAYVVTLEPPAPGDQAATYDAARDAYEEAIAPARTWGYARDAEALRRRGLAAGASLENTLVIGGSGFLNPPRFANEPARHKLLDLLGDLALVGRAICGAVIAVRAGHGVHVALARALRAQEAGSSS
jgi:UDP-3-O-[3-hydroxymyristoyl] N-acetylglucosamine deacetylase